MTDDVYGTLFDDVISLRCLELPQEQRGSASILLEYFWLHWMAARCHRSARGQTLYRQMEYANGCRERRDVKIALRQDANGARFLTLEPRARHTSVQSTETTWTARDTASARR